MLIYTISRLGRRASLLVGACVVVILTSTGVALGASTEVQEGWAMIRDSPVLSGVPPYDYSPTVIQESGYEQIWWCGEGSDQLDDIYYAKIRLSDGAFVLGPGPVMTPPQDNSWQGFSMCDPTVVEGAFSPGDGHTYKYAMYYTGSSLGAGPIGGIGVVYSDDGLTWNGTTAPYNPIIPTPADCQAFFGAGQPEAWNQNELGHVYLFYTDPCRAKTGDPANPGNVWVQQSVDQSGYHLSAPVQLSSAGIGAPWQGLAWNDGFAVDSTNGLLYVAAPNWRWCANQLGPKPAPAEMASFGVYSMPISSAVAGTGTWTQEWESSGGDNGNLPNGGSCNASRLYSPGFIRDGYGDLGPLKAANGGIRVIMARDTGYVYNSDLFWQQWTDPHP